MKYPINTIIKRSYSNKNYAIWQVIYNDRIICLYSKNTTYRINDIATQHIFSYQDFNTKNEVLSEKDLNKYMAKEL